MTGHKRCRSPYHSYHLATGYCLPNSRERKLIEEYRRLAELQSAQRDQSRWLAYCQRKRREHARRCLEAVRLRRERERHDDLLAREMTRALEATCQPAPLGYNRYPPAEKGQPRGPMTPAKRWPRGNRSQRARGDGGC